MAARLQSSVAFHIRVQVFVRAVAGERETGLFSTEGVHVVADQERLPVAIANTPTSHSRDAFEDFAIILIDSSTTSPDDRGHFKAQRFQFPQRGWERFEVSNESSARRGALYKATRRVLT